MKSFTIKSGVFLISIGIILTIISLFSHHILSAILSIAGKIIIIFGMVLIFMGENKK